MILERVSSVRSASQTSSNIIDKEFQNMVIHMMVGTYILTVPTVPSFLGFCCMQLSGEVYQYALIPRGIAACNRDFTFYQKKLLEPNPGKPRQITSYPKKFFYVL